MLKKLFLPTIWCGMSAVKYLHKVFDVIQDYKANKLHPSWYITNSKGMQHRGCKGREVLHQALQI